MKRTILIFFFMVCLVSSMVYGADWVRDINNWFGGYGAGGTTINGSGGYFNYLYARNSTIENVTLIHLNITEEICLNSSCIDDWNDVNVSIPVNLTPVNKTVATYIVAASNSRYKNGADYICDGTADQVEINHAINNLTNGGTVFLLEGTYVLNSSVLIDKDDVFLTGSGVGTNLTPKASSNIALIAVASVASIVYNVEISNLHLDGRRAEQSTGNCLKLGTSGGNDVSGAKIHHLTITGCDENAIRGSYLEHSQITNNYMRESDDWGVHVDHCIYLIVSDNIIDGGYGIKVEAHTGDQPTIINGNQMKGGADGIELASAQENVIISNNAFYSMSGRGIDTDGTQIEHIIVTGNFFSETGFGLFVNDGRDWVISNNHFLDSVSTSIYCTYCANSVISGNLIKNSDSQNTASYDGIFLDAGSDNNLIIGNRFEDNDRYGVRIDDTGSSDNLISGNVFIGSDYEGTIFDNGTNTIISGNIETSGGNILMQGDYNFTGSIIGLVGDGLGNHTASQDLNLSGNNILEVKNITSAYENKSYIFFQSDGSVGITLDPIDIFSPIISIVQAQEEIKPEVTRTASTETVCNIINGRKVCNLVLYSGVRFVEEDNEWKELWEAKSLKNSGINCIVESDNVHIAICDDFNYTHRKIKTSINQLSAIDKTKVPITVYYEEYNFETEKLDITEKSKEYYNFELIPNREEWIEASYGDIIKVGDKSTSIKLQIADGENLDDAYVNEWSTDADDAWGAFTKLAFRSKSVSNIRTYIKFNISAIPPGQLIDNATLSLYQSWFKSATFNTSVHHLYRHNWTEGVAGVGVNCAGQSYAQNITWNNQPCGTAFDNSVNCNLVAEDIKILSSPVGWKNWTVTNMVKTEYDDGDKNISIVLKATTESLGTTYENQFYSKEDTTNITLRPYLNITYSEAPTTVTSTLVSPADASTDNDGNVTFDCSATATVSVLKNISLYHNISGWKINQTNNVSGTSNSTTFTVNDIPDGTVLKWNCLASNNMTNISFAPANYTLTMVFPTPKRPKFFIQDMSGIKQWWVNSIGNMWLKRNLNVTGNITSKNVFIPQYIFSHTNATIPVKGANLWTNITFDQEDSDIKQGISHTFNDETNDTFTIMEDGIYNVDYDLDVEDTSPSASDIDVAARLILINGTEAIGSVFETDITKQGTEIELSHNFLVSCKEGEQFIFQFIADDADVQISTHGTYGEHPESATILMMKIANLP